MEPGRARPTYTANIDATTAALAETPDLNGAFPRLREAQIRALEAEGSRRPTREGEVLFREGDLRCDFMVVLDGKVEVVDGYGTPEQRTIAVHGSGRFLGELNLLTGQPSFTTAVVREPGEVLVVPVDRLRELVAEDTTLGDLVLRACLLRRPNLIRLGAGMKLVGSRYSRDTRRLREFAARNRLPYRFFDVQHDEAAFELLDSLGVAPEDTPVVIVGTDHVLSNPSNAELGRVLGLATPEPGTTDCELIVVGAGPAGLAAAVYGSSEGLNTMALDGVAVGGQASTSSRIENYLGFPFGISGSELAERAAIQARKFGARVTVPAQAAGLTQRDGRYVIELADGGEIVGETVVIASGVQYRRLPIPRLEEFESTSVYYAATQAEAMLCRGDPIAIVGGGNSAGQATLFLSQYAEWVTLVAREHELGENMSSYLAERVHALPNVDVRLHSEIRELDGGEALEAVVLEETGSGERDRVAARAVFVFIGADPHTDWLSGLIALDDGGYVLTGPDAAAQPGEDDSHEIGHDPVVLETNRPGVFAVGDVRSGSVKRVASAVGEGSMAVRLIHEHLARARSAHEAPS